LILASGFYCEPGEHEHAERCERLRHECRELHREREEFRECNDTLRLSDRAHGYEHREVRQYGGF
jgi:hypothetical protein